MPRWDLAKFNKVSTKLGSSMTSVGEVMAIGRNFEEAIQKATRMVSGGVNEGLDGGLPSNDNSNLSLDDLIRIPTDKRLWALQYAFENGYSVDEVHRLSRIDRWFLSKLKRIAMMKADTSRCEINDLNASSMKNLKCAGFSDRQIARYCNSTELIVRRRRQQYGIVPWTKQIDTLAAEFPAETNYLYMTYNGAEHDVIGNEASTAGNAGVMILGCGAYCIGSSVEFDWCAVSAVRQVRAVGDKAIVVNYNPETVSTDYDESDKLYFEELTLERVMDIYEFERAAGVVVSVGGQIPNNLALPLHHQGVRILGTLPDNIDVAEDRHKFSALLDSIGVDQPIWSQLTSLNEAFAFATKVGYPVILRTFYICTFFNFCYVHDSSFVGIVDIISVMIIRCPYH